MHFLLLNELIDVLFINYKNNYCFGNTFCSFKHIFVYNTFFCGLNKLIRVYYINYENRNKFCMQNTSSPYLSTCFVLVILISNLEIHIY